MHVKFLALSFLFTSHTSRVHVLLWNIHKTSVILKLWVSMFDEWNTHIRKRRKAAGSGLIYGTPPRKYPVHQGGSCFCTQCVHCTMLSLELTNFVESWALPLKARRIAKVSLKFPASRTTMSLDLWFFVVHEDSRSGRCWSWQSFLLVLRHRFAFQPLETTDVRELHE